ncbi:MAG: hypothetical protein K9H49_03005 [Bacteroidales bacterium]|nr:hypothetical protein [Bacteroidales bacterium]MCF8389227.1 hypothetical protein [Bacteroidales bacterium]
MKAKLKHRIFTGIFLAGALAGLNSCLDDGWDFNKISEEFVLTPSVATPIAYGELSLKDILTEFDSTGYVKQYDNDSLLYISYGQSLFSYSAKDVFDVPDQDFSEIYIEADIINEPNWMDPLEDTVLFEKRIQGDFKFDNEERLDSARIKSMDLEIKVISTFKHKGLLEMSSDSVFLEDGESFSDLIQISSANGDFDTTYIINLSNCVIYFENSVPGKTFLPLETDLFLIKSGNPVGATDYCSITMSFINIEYNSAFGYFGMYDLMIEDGDITIELFDNTEIDGLISFYDPQLVLTVDNSYGVPVQVELKDVSTYSSINDVTTPIVFTSGNPVSINAPVLDSIGTSVETPISIDRTNTNIAEAIETLPRKFYYTVSAVSNPLGPGDSYNFITDSSIMEVGVEIVLPIHLKADEFALEDTIDFDFEDQIGTNVDFIETFALELDVRNGLPLEVGMQLFFKDELFNMLDSMFVDDAFLLSPTLDGDGKVAEPVEYTKKVIFDTDRLEKIKTTKYLFVRASLNTTGVENGDFVKFFDYYNIYFKVKMESTFIINSRDL